ALGVQVKALIHLLGIAPAVLQPTVRKGRKISIFSENLVSTDEFLQLHQETLVADKHVQRVKRLHLVRLLRPEKAFAQRRHPQIHKSVPQSSLTKAAPTGRRDRLIIYN